ncbi:MAG: hypothetical protein GC172_09345 [Phycisphaera sp.]|nr:hypothetical protein [Phycisphaera sp.]
MQGHGLIEPVRSGERRLRIATDTRPRPDPRAERVYRQAVALEILSAREAVRQRALDPTDPRWVLAAETQKALQGAVLAFEDRRRLLALAQRVGIRPFDANLIVALVQDRARRGEPLEAAAATIAMLPAGSGPVSAEAVSPQAVPAQSSKARRAERPTGPAPEHPKAVAWTWAAAIVVACLVDAALIIWILFT